MKADSWLHRRGWAACLVLIVTVATLRSLQWVFLVPIYQAPDEAYLQIWAMTAAGGGARPLTSGERHSFRPSAVSTQNVP